MYTKKLFISEPISVKSIVCFKKYLSICYKFFNYFV